MTFLRLGTYASYGGKNSEQLPVTAVQVAGAEMNFLEFKAMQHNSTQSCPALLT